MLIIITVDDGKRMKTPRFKNEMIYVSTLLLWLLRGVHIKLDRSIVQIIILYIFLYNTPSSLLESCVKSKP